MQGRDAEKLGVGRKAMRLYKIKIPAPSTAGEKAKNSRRACT